MVNTTEAFEKIMAIFKAVAGGSPLLGWRNDVWAILQALQDSAIEQYLGDRRPNGV